MSNNLLEINQLGKKYKKSNFELKDISLNVPYGSIVGMIGENGAGKTTILSIILNLRKKDSGNINLFNTDWEKGNSDFKEKIGVVFDENCFPKTFTAKDISVIYKRIYKKWDEEYFFSLLEKFSVQREKTLGEYSKGMEKIVSIITAMSYHPQLLILDEPTSSLDPVKREEVLDLFLEFVEDERNSILFSSHITTDIEKVADYVTFIHQGEALLTEVKDTLIYEYGIIRCGRDEFNRISKDSMVAYYKRDYDYTILVSVKEGLIDSENRVIENPSLEEIATILSKGEWL